MLSCPRNIFHDNCGAGGISILPWYSIRLHPKPVSPMYLTFLSLTCMDPRSSISTSIVLENSREVAVKWGGVWVNDDA